MKESSLVFSTDEYMPLREVVFLTLRRRILRGELKPGERLMEIALATRLGVSRTPVREAIRKLEHEGLVVMVPRKGAHVAEISRQQLNDVLEIRKSLDVLAIRKAAQQMTEPDFAALREAGERFALLIREGEEDLIALGAADEVFHNVIYRSTNNRCLLEVLGNLREQMYRFRVEYLKDRSSHQKLVREHEDIISALERRDEEEAVRLIGIHIDNQYYAINRELDDRDKEEDAGGKNKS